jgi:hypothetical protein
VEQSKLSPPALRIRPPRLVWSFWCAVVET